MASRDPARVRSRRSIAHVPKAGAAADKEDSATEGSSIPGAPGVGKSGTKEKKSRSKSLGPGGLDALQNSNGNRRKVRCNPLWEVALHTYRDKLVNRRCSAQVHSEAQYSALATKTNPDLR